MTRATQSQSAKFAGRVAALVAAALLITGVAAAQEAELTPAAPPGPRFLVASTEDTLWVAEPGASESLLYRQTVTEPLKHVTTLNGRITHLVARERRVYALFDDRSFYSLSASETAAQVERALPRAAEPLDLVAGPDGLLALVPAPVALALRTPTTNEAEPPAEADTHLWIVHWRGGQWRPLLETGVPAAGYPERLTPQLVVAGGKVWAFWVTDPQPRPALSVKFATWSLPEGEPRQAGEVTMPAADAFWVANVNSVLMLATAAEADGIEEIALRCALVPAEGGAPNWKPLAADALVSDEAPIGKAVAAFGYNQHLGLLYTTLEGQPYLSFIRPDGRTLLAPQGIHAALEPAAQTPGGANNLGTLFVVLLVGVLATVLLLRRRTLMTPVLLPPEIGMAFTWQRLLAMLIDVTPFAVVVALLLDRFDYGAGEAINRLFSWALWTGRDNEGAPPMIVIWWWLLTIAMYTVYSTVMEGLTGRTIGKVLTRVRVVGIDLEKPGWGKIVLRNVLRLIEGLPPLWILAFFVVLTPKRQRVGDVLAQTMVVRKTNAQVISVDLSHHRSKRNAEDAEADGGAPKEEQADGEAEEATKSEDETPPDKS